MEELLTNCWMKNWVLYVLSAQELVLLITDGKVAEQFFFFLNYDIVDVFLVLIIFSTQDFYGRRGIRNTEKYQQETSLTNWLVQMQIYLHLEGLELKVPS